MVSLVSTVSRVSIVQKVVQMEFRFANVYGTVKPMIVALSTIFISLEYYFDLHCIAISFQCCNLLSTSMSITRKKFCKTKFHLFGTSYGKIMTDKTEQQASFNFQ